MAFAFHSLIRIMLIGHQKIWQFLKKSAELEKIPHGLLFSGQEKLGKRTLALEFIKYLNCENTDFLKRPCQSCRSCKDIQKGQHPDLVIVEPKKPASAPPSAKAPEGKKTTVGKEEIQIAQIRDLNWKLSLKPYSAPIKSAIIDQAHFMNQEAQNCFLKTLEEPKGKTLLILISNLPERLFPTILSRVQRIKFYPVKKIEIKEYLKNQGLSVKESEEAASLSLGRPGMAVDFAITPQKLESQQQKIKELIKISNSDLNSRFQYVKDLSREPQNLRETLEIWISYFRDALLLRARAKDFPPQGLEGYSSQRLKNILKLIQSTSFLILNTNVNPRLALEILMLEF